jgi:hypothetical protein
MWDALTHGFAESRSWFDPRNPIGPMLRIQGDAQLLKTLLLESLRDSPVTFSTQQISRSIPY